MPIDPRAVLRHLHVPEHQLAKVPWYREALRTAVTVFVRAELDPIVEPRRARRARADDLEQAS